MSSGLDPSKEVKLSQVLRDTSTFGQRVKQFLRNGDNAAMTMGGLAGLAFMMPAFSEIALAASLGIGWTSLSMQKKTGLPMQVPQSAHLTDAKEINLATKKPDKGKGILYIGNDQKTGEEIWLTDTQARTHMMFLGTTGSGKTEFLISVAFNALIHGSGLIYVDGKADNSLYGKIYSMCRMMGREDDVLLINFQTGAKDIFGAQPKKMSNTLNPFSVGSSGMLTQLVVGLMSGGKEGKSDVWENRAISFVEALLRPLVFLRDNYGLLLDVEVIRNYFNLEPLVALLTENMEKAKNEFGADIWVNKAAPRFPGIGPALSGLAAYIDNLPGYNPQKPVSKQESVVSEQHGYITMQLIRTFNSLADTYGYIMKTPLAEIDFIDVFLNRRILVVLLPALEKSPPELTNLGRIVVASIKSTMAVGLGADVEGDWSKIIDSKPTVAPNPYLCILDEYGYYAVEGFAVVPAQARSLGFSAIFAGQDLPAFEKASKSEAESTLANTTTKFCGKLECTKTFEYFKTLAGEAYYTKTGGFQNQASTILDRNYQDNQAANIEKLSRISNDDLRSQISGQWHMFYADRIVRINSFFSNPKKVKKLRTNHFVPIEPPSDDAARAFKRMMRKFDETLNTGFAKRGENGFIYYLNDAPPGGNFNTVFKEFSKLSQDGLKGLALGAKVFSEARRRNLSLGQDILKAYNEDDTETANERPAGARRSVKDLDFDNFVDMENDIDKLANVDVDEESYDFGGPDEDFANAIFNDEDDEDGDKDGLLQRESVMSGLAKIEQRIGRPQIISDVVASEITTNLSVSTQYPTVVLSEQPDLEDFFELSRQLQEQLMIDLKEDAESETED